MDDHDNVCTRFEALLWHDSKLVGVNISRNEASQTEEITLILSMWQSNDKSLSPAKVVFKECMFVRMDMDLEGKRLCADDICTGQCVRTSEWMQMFQKKRLLIMRF
jgi:hypothetical protein